LDERTERTLGDAAASLLKHSPESRASTWDRCGKNGLKTEGRDGVPTGKECRRVPVPCSSCGPDQKLSAEGSLEDPYVSGNSGRGRNCVRQACYHVARGHQVILRSASSELWVQLDVRYIGNRSFFTQIRGLLNADGWVVLYFSTVTARSHNMIATNLLQQRRLCGVQPLPMAN
jgi:hypothetical protein